MLINHDAATGDEHDGSKKESHQFLKRERTYQGGDPLSDAFLFKAHSLNSHASHGSCYDEKQHDDAEATCRGGDKPVVVSSQRHWVSFDTSSGQTNADDDQNLKF